jgi:MFS transporter, YNFM family, putative membrane transport protein
MPRSRPDFPLHFGLDGGKAAVVTPTPSLPGLAAPTGEPPLIARGGAGFGRLFLGSFATFAVLCCVQPLMPGLASGVSISPAAASLSLLPAVAIALAGIVSDVLSREAVMTASLFAAVAATLAASLSPGWTALSVLAFLVAMKLARVPPPAHPRPS